MFNQYPYLNLNDFNLDYILKAIKEMRYEVTNFVSINAIKYANPIQWDITRQYEKNTIVIDPVTGTAYISVAPVPIGVALNRAEYWTVVFDLQAFVTKANQNLANNYEEQTTTTATMNTSVGHWVIWGDVLYKALVNITAGDAYVVGGNIERITIEDVINAIAQDITNEVQARTDADTALQGAINGEVQARQNADTALQGAINGEVQARQDADTALQGAINDEVQARQDADTALQGAIGNISNLQTVDKSSTVAAINELVNTVSLDTYHKYVFIGDSYGLTPSASDNWITDICNILGLNIGTTAFPYCEGGASFGGQDSFPLFQDMINNISIVGASLESITDVVCCGGYNDISGVHGATTATTEAGIISFINNAKTRFPNARVHIGFIGGTWDGNLRASLALALHTYTTTATANGAHYLNNVEYSMIIDSMYQPDKIHPYSSGALSIARNVANALLTGGADVKTNYMNGTFTASSGVVLATFNYPVAAIVDNGLMMVNLFYNADSTQFTFSPAVDISNEIELGAITDTPVLGDAFGTLSTLVMCDVGGGSFLSNVPARLSIRNGKLYIKIFATMADMNGLVIKGRYSLGISTIEQ